MVSGIFLRRRQILGLHSGMTWVKIPLKPQTRREVDLKKAALRQGSDYKGHFRRAMKAR
jgi:hypothetical protein